MSKSKRCPTPKKIGHDTRAQAESQIRSLRQVWGKTAMVHPYHCPCGKWHVGGRRKARGRRR